MTKDVIELAREAGLSYRDDGYSGLEFCALNEHEDLTPALFKFAALVAARERERCAQLCESGADTEHPTVKGHIMRSFGASTTLAAAIRALNTEGDGNDRP